MFDYKRHELASLRNELSIIRHRIESDRELRDEMRSFYFAVGKQLDIVNFKIADHRRERNTNARRLRRERRENKSYAETKRWIDSGEARAEFRAAMAHWEQPNTPKTGGDAL